MSKKPSVQCYYCGKWSNSHTNEHVVAKCLAGDVPNIEFIRVPACLRCNNQFSIDESRFRDFLSVIGSGYGIEEADGALAAFGRSVGRRPGPNKDYQRIRNAITIRGIDLGPLHFGPPPIIHLPDDLDENKVLIKIARGLHFHHTGKIVPPHYVKDAVLIPERCMPVELRQMQYSITGDIGDFFHYNGWWSTEGSDSAVWVMHFYQRAIGIAWFHNTKVTEFTFPME